MTPPTRLLALPLLAAALAIGSACGTASERASEEVTERLIEAAGDGQADVEIGDEGFSVETEDGSFSSGGGEVPDSWPADVPLPELSDVASSEFTDATSGSSVTLTGRTKLRVDAAEAHFEGLLGSWTRSSRTDLGGDADSVHLIYELGDRGLLIGIVEDGDGVTLTLTHTDAS